MNKESTKWTKVFQKTFGEVRGIKKNIITDDSKFLSKKCISTLESNIFASSFLSFGKN